MYRSQLPSPGAQFLSVFTQPANPGGSGSPAEEVQILLPDKEFSRVDRVCMIAVRRGSERGFRCCTPSKLETTFSGLKM